MRFFSLYFTAAALVLSQAAVAAPSAPYDSLNNARQVSTADLKPGKYIVKVKDNESKSTVLQLLGPSVQVAHDWEIINGFAGNLDKRALDILGNSPLVEFIEKDQIMHTMAIQTNAPWGLSRLSSDKSLAGGSDSSLSYTYKYDDSAGNGVDIYVVDTGIFTEHTQFGGRASWGKTFGGYPDKDDNGHGTHCAGTAAGTQFGVAKKANLIAVKVLSGQGSGSTSDIVDGLNYVRQQAQQSGRPSVVSMSLGGGVSAALDDAVNSLANFGVHVVVAAGNDNADASQSSPARAANAITVGASNITDGRALFSNFGSPVAVFAPGQNVISAWNTNPSATNQISGTSMATPHISGLVAYLLALEGRIIPAQMKARIQELALPRALSNIPPGTKNLLAHIKS